MQVKELGHVVLYVRDLAQSRRFYGEILGFPELPGPGWISSLPGPGWIVGASDHTVTHSLYLMDPDGNEVELYVDVESADWRSDPALFNAPIKPLRL